MDAWLVALVSGGMTLLASLTTTFINGRTSAKNLRIQLGSEERRYEEQMRLEELKRHDQRYAEERSRLFDHQRESAVLFLTAMSQYQISSAKMLGARFARAKLDLVNEDEWEYETELEVMSGATAAREGLTSALSAVSIYLPETTAGFALQASNQAMQWVDQLSNHYQSASSDPGPMPDGVNESIVKFREEMRRLLGVEATA